MASSSSVAPATRVRALALQRVLEDGHLTLSDVIRLARTHQAFHQTAMHPKVWQHFFRRFRPGIAREISASLVTPDWRTLYRYHRVEAWRTVATSLATLTGHTSTLTGHTSRVNCVAVAGNEVYTASRDRTVRIYDRTTRAHLASLARHTDAVTCVAVAGNELYTASYDGTVRIWRAQPALLPTGYRISATATNNSSSTSITEAAGSAATTAAQGAATITSTSDTSIAARAPLVSSATSSSTSTSAATANRGTLATSESVAGRVYYKARRRQTMGS